MSHARARLPATNQRLLRVPRAEVREQPRRPGPRRRHLALSTGFSFFWRLFFGERTESETVLQSAMSAGAVDPSNTKRVTHSGEEKLKARTSHAARELRLP